MDKALLSVYCDDTIVQDPPDCSLLGQRFIGEPRRRADPKMRIIANGDTRLPDALASGAVVAQTYLPQSTYWTPRGYSAKLDDDSIPVLGSSSDSDTDDGRCPRFPKQRLTDYDPDAANYKRKRLRAVVSTTRHNAGGRPPSRIRVVQ